MRRATSILALLGLSAFLPRVLSSQEAGLRRTLPLTLEQSQGISVQGLRTPEVETKLRAVTARVLSIVPDDRPHRIVVLVDASASIDTAWREVLATALELANTTLPNTTMALVVFNDRIEEQVDFSQPQSVVAEKLKDFRSMTPASGPMFKGRTALYDSLLTGLQLLGNPTSADTLYLISDGVDSASRAHPDDAVRQVSSSAARLFVSFVVADPGHRSITPEEQNDRDNMIEMAKRTGGQVNVAISPWIAQKTRGNRTVF